MTTNLNNDIKSGSATNVYSLAAAGLAAMAGLIPLGIMWADHSPGSDTPQVDGVVTTADESNPLDSQQSATSQPDQSGSDLTDEAIGAGTTQVAGASTELPPFFVGERPTSHRVRRGDSLGLIAEEHGVTWPEIAAANDLDDPNLIVIGQVLQIPGSQEGAPIADTATIALVSEFEAASERHGTPAELAMAVAWVASEWDPNPTDQGESGIGRLAPDVLAFVSADLLSDATDPTTASGAVDASVAYLGWLLDETGGDTAASLAAWRQGHTSGATLEVDWSPATVAFIAAVLELRPAFVV